MSDNKYYIPKYIDEPFRVIIFTIDELALIVIIMVAAFIASHEIIGIVACAVSCMLYRKLKAQESSAFIRRYMYWHLGFGSRNVMPSATHKKYKG